MKKEPWSSLSTHTSYKTHPRTMSVEDCGQHGPRKRRLLYHRICSSLLVTLLLIVITILLIWAILQPKKPKFILQDATLYDFSVASNPNLLNSTFQITMISRNPNDKIGIYYDKLSIYATYHNQQITFPTSIPPSYQGHHEVNVWSPLVYGMAVPVAPYNSVALSEDQSRGSIMLLIKMDGRVRWKVGAFVSGRYHLYVRCEAFIPFGSRDNAVFVGENVYKYQMLKSCSVSV